MPLPTQAEIDAAIAKAGHEIDPVAKQKITVDLYVPVVVAIVANLIGVIFHF